MTAAVHIVALSGGKDSTAMALRLSETAPTIDFVYICTPTGNELDEMFEHWRHLGDLLGKPIQALVAGTLFGVIEKNNMIPNFRARFCTRQLKIEPYAAFLIEAAKTYDEIYSYVGIRADESEREAGDYLDIPGVHSIFPMQQWGWGLSDVIRYLDDRGVTIPRRTDCALCYHQRIGEWWNLYKDHPKNFQEGIDIEERMGHTFRSPGRDTWPVSLKDMRERFKSGDRPKNAGQHDLFGTDPGQCRVCRM